VELAEHTRHFGKHEKTPNKSRIVVAQYTKRPMSNQLQSSPKRKHSPSSGRKESPKKQKSIPKQKRRRKRSSQTNQSNAKRLKNEETEDRKKQQEEQKQLQREWQRKMVPVLRERQQSIELELEDIKDSLYGYIDYCVVESMKSNEKPPEEEIYQFLLSVVEIVVDYQLNEYDDGIFNGIAQEKTATLLQEIEKEPEKWLAGRMCMFVNAYDDMWGKDLTRSPSIVSPILFDLDEENSEESDVEMGDEE
jgi:hypothetical protein